MQYWELNKWRNIFKKRAESGDKFAQRMLTLWDKDRQAYIKELKPILAQSKQCSQVV